MSKKIKHHINAENLIKLEKIFSEKKWEIKNDSKDELSLFNRFSNLLFELSNEEQSLILELTERYIKVDFDDYLLNIESAIKTFLASNIINMDEITKLYFAPLKPPEDFEESKSSDVLLYLLRGSIKYMPEIGNKKNTFLSDLNVEHKHINRDNCLLLLFDDFIGTGETACSAIDYLINDKMIDKDKIVVFSIAALEIGIQSLINKNILHYTSIALNKGISDNYTCKDELLHKLNTMDSIETKIKAHKKERLGYNKSEALITLIRTPNNTFPVFWKEKGARLAPFPRH